VIFALLMANAGGLWDNAKKFIETGQFGGVGSDAHKSSVVGDTVGDPFKDTAGPSLNTLITVMSLVSSLFAPIIAAFHLF
jgi:K(+)-stimulated pyrophosphate-energized sodium pump